MLSNPVTIIIALPFFYIIVLFKKNSYTNKWKRNKKRTINSNVNTESFIKILADDKEGAGGNPTAVASFIHIVLSRSFCRL